MGKEQNSMDLKPSEYPSPRDLREANESKSGKQSGHFGFGTKVLRGAAAVLEIGGTLAGVAAVDVACTPQPAAEVHPAVPTPTEEEYLESLRKEGVPTAVAIGGPNLSEDIATKIKFINAKISARQPLTADEKAYLIQFNKEHPQLGEVPATGQTPKPPEPTKTSVPADPTATEGPKNPPAPVKKEWPPEGQQFLNDMENISTMTPEQRQAVQKGFERDWNQADNEIKKYNAYTSLYSSLYAGWNVTKDPAIKAEMKQIQEFLGSRPEWKQRYDLHVKAGAFLD